MILSDFTQRCGWPAKPHVVRARLAALGLLVTCRRCGGTGVFEANPADPMCYGCSGKGKKLPPLTARLAAQIRARQEHGDLDAYFAELRERRGDAGAAPEETPGVLVPDLLEK